MKTKYYKNVSPDSAKNRIAKLVNAHAKAWEHFRSIKKHNANEDSILYKHALKEACGLSQALRIMGIVELEILENL